MPAADVQTAVDGSPGDGTVVLVLRNVGTTPVEIAHAPVVGIRARAEAGGWRAACRLDLGPARFSPLPAGGSLRVSVPWLLALKTDLPPPPGRYLVRLAVVIGDDLRLTDPAPTSLAST